MVYSFFKISSYNIYRLILQKFYRLTGVLIIVCYSTFSNAQTEKLSKELIKGKLENGFQYYIKNNTYPLQKTLFYLVVKAGAIHEKDQELGYAHFLEHMAFKGGKRFQEKKYITSLYEQGLQLGKHFNAVTNYQYTIYSIEFPKEATLEMQEEAFAFFADILDGLSLDNEAIASEKRIVLEEKKVAPKVSEYFKFRLGESKYKYRLPIGTENSIKNITRESLGRFYDQWYQPEKAAVFVVGNVFPSQTASLIKQQFETIKNKRTNSTVNEGIYEFLEEAMAIDISDSYTSSRLFLEWGWKRQSEEQTEDVLRRKIVYQMLGRILQKRTDSLFSKSIDGLKLTDGYFMADVNYTTISCNPKTNPEMTIKNILREIKRIALYGVPENELQYHLKKNQQFITYKEDNFKQSGTYIQEYLDQYLDKNGSFFLEKKDSIIQHHILSNINSRDFKNEAQKLWDSNTMRLFFEQAASDDTKNKFSLQKFRKLKKQLDADNILPLIKKYARKKNSLKKTSKNRKLTVPEIEEEKALSSVYYPKLGITRLTYKNGLDVVLKPVKSETDVIEVVGLAPGGTSSISDSLYYQYESTIPYIELGGIGNLTDRDLEQYLSDKDFSVSFAISEFERNIHASTPHHQLEEFFKYLFIKMTATKTNEKEFTTVVQDEIKALKKRTSHFSIVSPFKRKVDQLKKNYFPNRNGAQTKEEFENLNLSQMHNFYQKAFANADSWRFIITGNFNKDSMLPYLNNYLGNLPHNNNRMENKELFTHSEHEKELVIKDQKSRNTTSISFVLYGGYTPTVRNTILISLTERLIRNRVVKTLREQYGMTYTPFVELEKKRYPASNYVLEIHFDCTPDKIDKAKKITQQVLEDIITSPIQEKELKYYKNGVVLKHNMIVSDTDIYNWNSYIIECLSNNEKIEDLEKFPAILSAISKEELHAFIKRSLDVDKTKIVSFF